MNFKTTFLSVVMLFLYGQSTANDSVLNLSLKQICRMGIEKNADIKNAEFEKQKIYYQRKETESRLYPQLESYSNFNYYYSIPKSLLPGEIFGQKGLIPVEFGTNYDWSSGFKATQILYNKSVFTSLRISKQMMTIGTLALKQKTEEIIYQISQVYYLCLATKEQLLQYEKSISNTEQMLGIAKLQTENGVLRNVDYSKILVNKNNLQTEIENLNCFYNAQLGMLKYLTGISPETELLLTDTFIYKPAIIVNEYPAEINRTEYQFITAEIDIAKLKMKQNYQLYQPSFTFFGQHYYQAQRNDIDFFDNARDKFFKTGIVGVSVILPIFDGFERRSKIRQAEIELEQLSNERKKLTALFSKEYTDAKEKYGFGLKALLRQQENIKIAEQNYAISLQGYRYQTVSLSDLLVSESGLTDARLSYVNALLQLLNADLEFKKAKGYLLNH